MLTYAPCCLCSTSGKPASSALWTRNVSLHEFVWMCDKFTSAVSAHRSSQAFSFRKLSAWHIVTPGMSTKILSMENRYYSQFLKNEFHQAITTLFATQPTTPKARALKKRCQKRFGPTLSIGPIRTFDPFVRALVTAVRVYWTRCFLQEWTIPQADEALLLAFRTALITAGRSKVPITQEALFQRTGRELTRRGFHHCLGKTLPFICPYIWKNNIKKTYTVDLPLAPQKLPVVFMSGFVEPGWMHFGTFGRYATGGWVAHDAIYCVKSRYKPNSEAFRVSFLTHEAQHFQDKATYPQLKQLDLEYRAKLAEILSAKCPLLRLRKLAHEATDNPANPHGHAAYLIQQGLSLAKPTANQLRESARGLLDSHTQKLNHAGPSTTTVLP